MSIKRAKITPAVAFFADDYTAIDKAQYESQITDILGLWDQTLLSISSSNMSNITKERLSTLNAEWRKLSDEILDIDIAIRYEVNMHLFSFQEHINQDDLTTAHAFTGNAKYEFEYNETQVPFKRQEATFKILRLCSILNRKTIRIMDFLQKVKDEFCGLKSTTEPDSVFQNENHAKELLDKEYLASALDRINNSITDVSKKIKNLNRKDFCKPISQKRCAELIVEELEDRFPHISVVSIKRMLSDWDTGKKEAVKGYFQVKQLADEKLFRKWASTYFLIHYEQERRGKYIRKKIIHDPNAMDKYALTQYTQDKNNQR